LENNKRLINNFVLQTLWMPHHRSLALELRHTKKKCKGSLSTASRCNNELIQPVVDAKEEATTVGHGVRRREWLLLCTWSSMFRIHTLEDAVFLAANIQHIWRSRSSGSGFVHSNGAVDSSFICGQWMVPLRKGARAQDMTASC
jgi:hypothetical protein